MTSYVTEIDGAFTFFKQLTTHLHQVIKQGNLKNLIRIWNVFSMFMMLVPGPDMLRHCSDVLFPPSVVDFDYRLRENIKGGGQYQRQEGVQV